MATLGKALTSTVAVAAVVVCAGWLILRNGFAADRPPGRIETAIARRLVVLSIPAAMRTTTNPHGTDPDAWRSGADHFAEHCAVCHGGDGRGSPELAAKMYPPVPNLASREIQALSDGALFAVIQNGVRWTGMPAFRSEHTPDETWRLVSFIRRIPALDASDEHQRHGGDHHDGNRVETIEMDGTSFVPNERRIHVRETITWINKDPFPHNVTSVAGGFTSGDLEPDQKWQFRAAKTGRFPYVCTLHPGMSGTLIVEP